MKIIDLLNKIANGETPPKRIKFKYNIYELGDNEYYFSEDVGYLFDKYYATNILNGEIEIIDNKKIEKLKKEKIISGMLDNEIQYIEGYKLEDVGDKINEIIDYILNKEE